MQRGQGIRIFSDASEIAPEGDGISGQNEFVLQAAVPRLLLLDGERSRRGRGGDGVKFGLRVSEAVERVSG